jgi:hypothetical protein
MAALVIALVFVLKLGPALLIGSLIGATTVLGMIHIPGLHGRLRRWSVIWPLLVSMTATLAGYAYLFSMTDVEIAPSFSSVRVPPELKASVQGELWARYAFVLPALRAQCVTSNDEACEVADQLVADRAGEDIVVPPAAGVVAAGACYLFIRRQHRWEARRKDDA